MPMHCYCEVLWFLRLLIAIKLGVVQCGNIGRSPPAEIMATPLMGLRRRNEDGDQLELVGV